MESELTMVAVDADVAFRVVFGGLVRDCESAVMLCRWW